MLPLVSWIFAFAISRCYSNEAESRWGSSILHICLIHQNYNLCIFWETILSGYSKKKHVWCNIVFLPLQGTLLIGYKVSIYVQTGVSFSKFMLFYTAE